MCLLQLVSPELFPLFIIDNYIVFASFYVEGIVAEMCRVGFKTLRLNFRLKVTFRANIYGWLDGEWLYYNFAAGSFHAKKLCSRLYSIEIEFYSNTQKSLGDLRVTYALHL